MTDFYICLIVWIAELQQLHILSATEFNCSEMKAFAGKQPRLVQPAFFSTRQHVTEVVAENAPMEKKKKKELLRTDTEDNKLLFCPYRSSGNESHVLALVT